MSTVSAFLTAEIVEGLKEIMTTAVDNVEPTLESLITNALDALMSSVQNDLTSSQVPTISQNIANSLESALTNALSNLVSIIESNIETSSIPTIVSNFTDNVTDALNDAIPTDVVPAITQAIVASAQSQAPSVASDILTQISGLIIDNAANDLGLSTTIQDLDNDVQSVLSRLGDPSSVGIGTVSNGISTAIVKLNSLLTQFSTAVPTGLSVYSYTQAQTLSLSTGTTAVDSNTVSWVDNRLVVLKSGSSDDGIKVSVSLPAGKYVITYFGTHFNRTTKLFGMSAGSYGNFNGLKLVELSSDGSVELLDIGGKEITDLNAMFTYAFEFWKVPTT